MARTTPRKLAGSAVSAARKAIGKRTPSTSSSAASTTTATKTTAKKSTATKSAAKKSSAQKTTAKKAAAQKTTPTSAATKKAAAKTTATKAAPAKKAPAKKAPAKKAPSRKAPAKQAPASKKASATKTPAAKAPAKKAPAKKAPATKAPAKKAPAKKTPAKKAPAKRTPATNSAAKKPATKASTKPVALVVKEGEEAWTKVEIKEVTKELQAEREKVQAFLTAQEEELAGLMRDSGDGAGQDQADMGATSFERDHELTVVNNEREKLLQIDRALARIDDGSYGICESCGNPIGKLRLMAFPRATLCMTCKQREERR